MRRSAEARESLLRPSELHRRSRAAVLAASCGKLFSIWRQDGVVDASSGVVHASLQASQARIKTQRPGCLARESQLGEKQPSHVSDAALALRGEKLDDSNSNVLYYSQRVCCGRRTSAVIDF